MIDEDARDDEWANRMAGGTFKWTLITAVLFVVFVAIFVLFR